MTFGAGASGEASQLVDAVNQTNASNIQENTEPSSEEQAQFMQLLTGGNQQPQPENVLTQMLHNASTDFVSQTNKVENSSLDPASVVKNQESLAEMALAFNEGSKVVGQFAKAVNQLDSMS